VKVGRALLVATAFASLGVCYWVAFSAPAVGTYHDDGIYVVTAKALAQGDGYRIVSLPEPLPQTKYPILFPFLLSLVWRLVPQFPANAPFLKLLPLAAGLLWCALSFRVVKAQAGPIPAVVIAWLTLASPWVVFLSTTMLAETTFAALCWASLLLLDRMSDEAGRVGRRDVAWALAAGLLAGAAVLTRTVGIAMVAAGTLWLLAIRRPRPAAGFVLAALAVAAPWFVWASSTARQIPAAAGYYSSSNYLNWTVLWNFEWTDKLTVVLSNTVQTVLAPAKLLGLPKSLTLPLGTALGVLMVVGLVRRARTQAGVLEFFFLFSLGLILLWPWPVTRFLVPMYPLVLLYMWTGFVAVVEKLSLADVGKSRLTAAAVTVTLALGFTGMASASRYIARSGISWPVVTCDDRWADYQAIASWIRSETPDDAVLVSTLDPLFYLYSGRKAARAFSIDPVELYYKAALDREPLGPPARLIDRIKLARADYLVDAPGSCFGEEPFLRRQIDALRRRAPDDLRPIPDAPAWARWIFHVRRPR